MLLDKSVYIIGKCWTFPFDHPMDKQAPGSKFCWKAIVVGAALHCVINELKQIDEIPFKKTKAHLISLEISIFDQNKNYHCIISTDILKN